MIRTLMPLAAPLFPGDLERMEAISSHRGRDIVTRALVAAAATFFTQLEMDNSRSFWQSNRAVYDQEIRPSFAAIIDGIAGFAGWRIYRPHNDTRFQSNKGPYKTFIGAVAERDDGVGVFVQLSKRGFLIGTGMPMPAPDQLSKLRAAIAAEDAGTAFVDAVSRVQQTGSVVHGGRWEALKRVPKPFDSKHSRGEYLCWKGVEVNYRLRTVEWSEYAEASAAIATYISQAEPLHAWLATHVGPSSMTAEERFAPKKQR